MSETAVIDQATLKDPAMDVPPGPSDGTVGNAPEKQVPRKEARLALLLVLLLAAVYMALPVVLNGWESFVSPDTSGGFWAPDSGTRFAMIRSWVEHGRLIRLYYPSAALDPTGQIHPLAYFLFHQAHGFCAMYPPLFPFLSGLAYRAFGFAGLTLVPALCGLGCVLVTYATARRLHMRSRLLLLPALGLATPLVLYSSVFWDHSAIMLVMALAGYWMLRSVQEGSFWNAVLFGAVVGLGMWIHELFLAFFVAAWLTALPLRKSYRQLLIGSPVGFLALVLPWGLFNWWNYGGFGGPHLGANVLQNNPDHPFGLEYLLNLNDLAGRAMAQLAGTGITNASPELWPYCLTLACLLGLYAATAWGTGLLARWVMALGFVTAVVASLALVKTFVNASNYAPPLGLFEATPLLIPVLAVPWHDRKTQDVIASGDSYFAWLSRACCLFLFFLILNPMMPGTDWGSRYLLSALPLLALLSAYALDHQYQNVQGRWRSVMAAGVATMIGMSLVCQGCGLIWVRRNIAYGQELSAQVGALSTPVLVTDKDWLGPRIMAWPAAQARFLVRSDDDARLLSDVLQRTKATEFAFVGTEDGENKVEQAVEAGGLTVQKTEAHPLFQVDTRWEQGDEIQLARFTLKAGKQN